MRDSGGYLSLYDPSWPGSFRAIVSHLRSFAGPEMRCEHVGSTSIPGMTAKPIIDLIAVAPKGGMESLVETLRAAGYLHQGDLGIEGREAFMPDSEATQALPPHHLYACEEDAEELIRETCFRDYLRSNPEVAFRLSQVKAKFAWEDGLGRSEYLVAKASFVAQIASEAMAWAHSDRPE